MNVKEQIKLKKWAASMAEQQASGLSISQWCHMKGISASGFHYRSKRVREAMQDIADNWQESNDIVPSQAPLQDTKFAKVEIVAPDMDASATSGIDIRISNMQIHINPDSNIEHVRLIMETMTNA